MTGLDSLEPAIPHRPDFLSGRQVELWDTIAPKVHGRRILTLLDERSLAGLCVVVDRHLLLRERVKAGEDLAEAAEAMRLEARKWAALFFMVAEERLHLAPLTAEGDDEELLRWFEVERAA